ncbi:MAG TPA: hypothetical protein VEL10_05635 [Gaiellaceae bacterium]|nr:hypothetical protein [Gaiellaceae bacterium]
MRRVVPEAEAPEVWFGEPVEEGDRAAIEWWALLVEPNGEKSTIAGCRGPFRRRRPCRRGP